MPAVVRLPAERKKTETDISREIRKALDKLGIPNWRMNSGKMRVRGGFVQLNPAGTPDILAAPEALHQVDGGGAGYSVWRPTFLWIEVKKPGGSLTRDQEEFSVGIRNRGHHWLCVENLDEVLAWLTVYRAR